MMVNVVTIYLVVTQGWLAWNPTLFEIGVRRQWRNVSRPISHQIRVSDYACAVGMPHGYKELIGRQVFFRDQEGLHGPWLVTDVESVVDQPHMRQNHLAADVACWRPLYDEMVHRRGEILIRVRRLERRH